MKDSKLNVFLLGSYRNNAGSDNVNRCLLENSPYDFLHIERTGRLTKRVEILCKIIRSKVIVFSGFGKNRFWMFLAKFLKQENNLFNTWLCDL